jgi:hypothetical protein
MLTSREVQHQRNINGSVPLSSYESHSDQVLVDSQFYSDIRRGLTTSEGMLIGPALESRSYFLSSCVVAIQSPFGSAYVFHHASQRNPK